MSNTDTTATEFRAYTVTLDTPQGEAQLDLKATSPDLAGKRAWMAAVQAGWGDLDEVTVTSVTDCLDSELLPYYYGE